MKHTELNKGYRADIDGLRAVAVLSVLGFHAFPGYFPGGFFGVDIFYVLSGYLITSILLTEQAQGHFSLRRFYARRIRRLFPAALTVIGATAVAGYILLFSHEFARLASHIWASLFFVENILLSQEAGYFDVSGASKPMLHFWSLAVEEQFYLIWPLALAMCGKRPRVTGALIALVLAASLMLTAFGGLSASWLFFSPLTRAWELAAGAALAWQGLHRASPGGSHDPRLVGAISIVALLLLGAVILIGPLGLQQPGWMTLVPVLSTVALLATGPSAFANAWLLARRPAVLVGLVSYPLYLWHWPLLSYAFIILGERGSTMLRLSLMLAALLLAAATHRWIEKPLRFTWPQRPAIITLLTGALVLAGATFAARHFRPAQTDALQAVVEDQLEGTYWRFTTNDLCKRSHKEHYFTFCMQKGRADPAILFVGNSYANHLFPGIADRPEFQGLAMLAFGRCEPSQTFPVDTEGKDQCDQQFKMLRSYQSVRMVILGNQWPMFDHGGAASDLRSSDLGKVASYPDVLRYRRGLQRSILGLASRGVPVVIFGPKPELGYDVADCYGRPLRPAKHSCLVDRRQFDRESEVTVQILRGIANDTPNVYYFDMAALFCHGNRCSYRSPTGAPYLRDTGHLSVIGSRYVAAQFVRWANVNHVPLPSAAAR